MRCTNCNFQWCWYCGLGSSEYGGISQSIHMFCGPFIELIEIKNNCYRLAAFFGIFILFLLGPALALIILAGYYIFALVLGTVYICVGEGMSYSVKRWNIFVKIIIIIVQLALFWPLSVVALGVVACVGAIGLVLCYIILIFTIFRGLIQWCLQSKQSKARSDYIRQIEEPMLEMQEDYGEMQDHVELMELRRSFLDNSLLV